MGRSSTASQRRVYRSRRGVARVVAATILAAVAGVLIAGFVLSRGSAEAIPPGVAIGGIEVGGKQVDEVRALLERETGARLDRRIVLEHGTLRLETSPSELGADARVDRLIRQAIASRGRLSRLWARLGLAEEIEIPLDFAVRPRRVRAVVNRIAGELEQPMRPAAIGVLDGRIVVSAAQDGVSVDRAVLFERLSTLPSSVELPLVEQAPEITDEDAARARAIAESLVDSPPAVVYEGTRVQLEPETMRRALRFRTDDGVITVALDQPTLAEVLRRGFARIEREPRDARFRVRGDAVSIVPGANGRKLDVGLTVRGLMASPDAPEVVAVLEDVEPALTTEEAETLGVVEVVGSFTTEFPCCAPRVTNIRRGARLLDEWLIQPGKRFSLNVALGRRTEERGFVEAPMIGEGGRLVDAVGGGVSQIATTLFNAAYFAGLQLVEHTPHTFYISRYPMGREATVSWGGPELVFVNDWPAGVLVDTSVTDTSITVRMFSSKLGRRITTKTGQPYGYKAPTTRYVLNPSLPVGSSVVVQSGGVDGFSVRYWRKVFRDGELVKEEAYVTHYDAEDTIVEVGPKPKPKPKPKPGEAEAADSGSGEGDPAAGEVPAA